MKYVVNKDNTEIQNVHDTPSLFQHSLFNSSLFLRKEAKLVALLVWLLIQTSSYYKAPKNFRVH